MDSKVFEHQPHLRQEGTYSGELLNLCVRLSTRTERAQFRHGCAPEPDMAPPSCTAAFLFQHSRLLCQVSTAGGSGSPDVILIQYSETL